MVEGIADTVALPDGSVETRRLVEAFTGTIPHIFETSADFCLELSSHAPSETKEDAQSDAKGVMAPDASTTGTPPSAKNPEGSLTAMCQAGKWEDIEISFTSEERVQITMGAETETRNYEEMGFANKTKMAEGGGVISVAADGRTWAGVEKRMQQIRKVPPGQRDRWSSGGPAEEVGTTRIFDSSLCTRRRSAGRAKTGYASPFQENGAASVVQMLFLLRIHSSSLELPIRC